MIAMPSTEFKVKLFVVIAELLNELLHFGVHVAAFGTNRNCGTVRLVEQRIAVMGIGLVVVFGPVFEQDMTLDQFGCDKPRQPSEAPWLLMQ